MALATRPSSSCTSSWPVERGRLPQRDSTARIAFLKTLQGTQRASAPNGCGGTGFSGDDGAGGGVTSCGGMDLLHRDLRGDPPLADGVAYQIGGVVHVELLHEAAAMKLRRLDADVQDLGNLFRRFAFADELEDLPLAGSEVRPFLFLRGRPLIKKQLRGAVADVEPPVTHFFDRVNQVVGALAFLYETPHAGLQRFAHESRVIDAGQQDHGAVWSDALDFAGGIDAIEDGHGDVQNCDVWCELLHGGYRSLAVRLVGDDLQAAALNPSPRRACGKSTIPIRFARRDAPPGRSLSGSDRTASTPSRGRCPAPYRAR